MANLFWAQKYRWYWMLRSRLLSARLLVDKTIFSGRRKVQDARENLSIVDQLLILSVTSLVLALLILALLQFLELAITGLFPTQLRLLVDARHRINQDAQLLGNLLGTIAATSGVFIGLYFTAVSVVASTVFSKASDELRNCLLREKVGNVYIKMLSVLLSASLIAHGIVLLQQDLGVTLAFALIVLGCVGAIGFIHLGLRVFYFFDPSSLADIIFRDLLDHTTLATAKGPKWSDASFQAYYQRLASADIGVLRALIEVCLNEAHLQGKSLITIVRKACFFLERYQDIKNQIPTKSYWFAMRPSYQDELLLNESELALSLESRTITQPQMIHDPYWLEDEIIATIEKVTKNSLASNEIGIAIETLQGVNSYLEVLGRHVDLERAQSVFQKLDKEIGNFLVKQPVPAPQESYEDKIFLLADYHNLGVMAYALGFYRFARECSVQDIIDRIARVNWKKENSLYFTGFPPQIMERLEYMQTRLDFEFRVEGMQISPNWYINQLVIIRYAEIMEAGLSQLQTVFKEFFENGSGFLFQNKHHILAALRAQRGLEACYKMGRHLEYFEKLFGGMEQHVVEKELHWKK